MPLPILFFFVLTNDVEFSFQGSTDGGSSYGVAITSTGFDAYANEAGSAAALAYASDQDLAQSTSFQIFQQDYGNDNDQINFGMEYLIKIIKFPFIITSGQNDENLYAFLMLLVQIQK